MICLFLGGVVVVSGLTVCCAAVRLPSLYHLLVLGWRCCLFLALLSVVLQCAFLVWCMVPGPANGSLLLYEKVLRPVFLKHEKQIDQVRYTCVCVYLTRERGGGGCSYLRPLSSDLICYHCQKGV